MRDSHTLGAIRAALQYVLASDMPAEHRAVLIEVLTHAIRSQEAAQIQRQAAEQVQTPWQSHEATQLQDFLQGKIANSWQHADELLMHLAAQLHRRPNDVRAKATELGLGAGVDYRLAKEHTRAQGE